ncbi:hypothetical protein CU098_008831 [Rhizopus stolonifer]|uniref:Uncharacterized protein n=1 Tax=Rhizopus stolonifer TaxID=4846 RepID=A0A367KR35_RHIST|nr:hypothetical protein CU098_008831 [Rhizopus stolonifer]
MVDTTSSFFHFNDTPTYSSELLDLLIKTLKQNANHLKTEISVQLGEGFQSVTRPWALVLAKEPDIFQDIVKNRVMSIHTRRIPPEERFWLNSIQVCRVENIHQLRAIICALHMKETNQEAHHIIQWIEREKDGQPPNMIVVVDLLDYLVNRQDKLNDPLRYLYIDGNELCRALSVLVEVCVYETKVGRMHWEKALGFEINHFTELLITDKDCLPSLHQITKDYSPFVKDGIQKLHQILNYYIDKLYI